MKSKFFIALSMLVCMSAISLVFSSCGKDDEPIKDTTMTQEYVVKGEITSQDGNYANGEAGLNDPNTAGFKFYKGIYDEVKEIIKAQVWEVSFKSSEKSQKIKEQNAVAESRYSAMVKALDAVQKKLDAADKNTYKCSFSMTIKLSASGESQIVSGQKTLRFNGNE